MTVFAVWAEGYVATGQSGQAMLLGHAYADTFAEACEKVMSQSEERKRFFNREHLTYWGCRLFDNPTDARRSFG